MTADEPDGSNARDVRDSVFLHAIVTAIDGTKSGVFRIRNISSSGLMAEGPINFHAGDELDVELRNLGTIHGRVAWASPGRFGLRFDHRIDPKAARMPIGRG